jgi:alpha-glucosidase
MAEWWRDAVFYEIYVRSFADSNGDGVGDLQGIRSKLPYLRDLGVDALWLTPFYPSPGADHGYDVAVFVGVDPQFGTLEDFDALVADAHALGMHLIVDVVPNHTSIEHAWFREHPERYVWAPGRNGGPPNNWPSNFGGPAWTFDPQRDAWYLHLFAPEQPDLDWHRDDVRDEFEQILAFWLDRGVDGFRIDVGHALVKEATLRDQPEPFPTDARFYSDWQVQIDQPEVHEIYRAWRGLLDSYEGDRMMVGEVVFTDPARVAPYVREDEMQLAFNFTLVDAPWDAAKLRTTIDSSLDALPVVTWVFENHDVTRIVTRYGEREARAAALLLLGLPGPVFLYQGQELALEEVDLPDEARQDPIFARTGGERKGRDGCRVPIPWERKLPRASWLPVPPEWSERSVEAQLEDDASPLALYGRALELRPGGDFAWRESPPGTLVFERDGTTVAVNVDAESLTLPEGPVLLASEPGIERELPPGTAAWIGDPR